MSAFHLFKMSAPIYGFYDTNKYYTINLYFSINELITWLTTKKKQKNETSGFEKDRFSK